MKLLILVIACLAACGFAEDNGTKSTTQPSSRAATTVEFQTFLRDAKPGDVIQTPFTKIDHVPSLEYTHHRFHPREGAVQSLLSDKPEYFRTGDGIAMQEAVHPGFVRLYVYHVPEPTGAKKTISAVIENLSDTEMNLDFRRYSSPKPSGDYHRVACEAMAAYLGDEPPPQDIAHRRVPPRGRMVIDPKIDAAVVTKDILVHVLHEFRIDQPARITVFQRDPDADSLKVIDTLPKLPRVLPGSHPSGAGRGLFVEGADQSIRTVAPDTYDAAAGPRKIVVADGKTDPWITGRDSIDPSSPIENKGNYGVMYGVKLQYKSTDARGVAVLMTAHRPDNHWCKYTAAVIKINDGINRGGVITLPSTQKHFQNLPQAAVMQTYPPAPPGEERTIEFTYTPPGACCLPTPILLVPFDAK